MTQNEAANQRLITCGCVRDRLWIGKICIMLQQNACQPKTKPNGQRQNLPESSIEFMSSTTAVDKSGRLVVTSACRRVRNSDLLLI